jgi:hypothetical protein
MVRDWSHAHKRPDEKSEGFQYRRMSEQGREPDRKFTVAEPPPESGTAFGSAMAQAGRRAGAHFGGADASREGADRIELWGTRIGRALSLAGCLALAVYLYLTYLR